MRYVLTLFLLLPFFVQAQQACVLEQHVHQLHSSTINNAIAYQDAYWCLGGEASSCKKGYLQMIDTCGAVQWLINDLHGPIGRLFVQNDTIIAFGMDHGGLDVSGDEAFFYQRFTANGSIIDSQHFTQTLSTFGPGLTDPAYYYDIVDYHNGRWYVVTNNNTVLVLDMVLNTLYSYSSAENIRALEKGPQAIYLATDSLQIVLDDTAGNPTSQTVPYSFEKLLIEDGALYALDSNTLEKYSLPGLQPLNSFSLGNGKVMLDMDVHGNRVSVSSINGVYLLDTAFNQLQQSIEPYQDVSIYQTSIANDRLAMFGVNKTNIDDPYYQNFFRYRKGYFKQFAFQLDEPYITLDIEVTNSRSNYSYTIGGNMPPTFVVQNDVYVTVKNNSNSVITSLGLHARQGHFPFPSPSACYDGQVFSYHDSLQLAPGDTTELHAGQLDMLFPTSVNPMQVVVHAVTPNAKVDSSSENNRHVHELLIDVGIKEPQNTINLTLSPNPVNQQLTISTNHTGPLQLQLLSISGKTLLQQSITGNQTVDVSRLSKGLYMAVVRDGKGQVVYREKIVKL